jgi:hypothetical protein
VTGDGLACAKALWHIPGLGHSSDGTGSWPLRSHGDSLHLSLNARANCNVHARFFKASPPDSDPSHHQPGHDVRLHVISPPIFSKTPDIPVPRPAAPPSPPAH